MPGENVEIAREKATFSAPDEKEVPRIGIEKLREIVGSVTHHLDRAILVTRFVTDERQLR